MSQVDNPSPLDSLVPKALNESSHDNPELHFIGSALLRPSRVSNVVPGSVGNVGVLPSAAREDHVHGMASTGDAPPIDAGDIVSGVLPVARGGTGRDSHSYGLIVGNGTDPFVNLPIPAPVNWGGTGQTFLPAGQFLVGNGAGPILTSPGPTTYPLTPFNPTLVNVNVGVGGSATGYYQFLTANALFFEFVVTLGSSGFSVGSGPRVVIPEGRSAALVTVLCTGTFRHVSTGKTVVAMGEVITAGTSVDLLCEQVSGSEVVRTTPNGTTPFTWAAGDIMRLSILTFIF